LSYPVFLDPRIGQRRITMRSALVLLVAVVLLSTAAEAQKVTVEYAADFDYGSLESYQVIGATDGATADQLIYDRIKHAIIRDLHRTGLRTASKEPDLTIGFSIAPSAVPVPAGDDPSPVATGDGWRRWKGDPAPPILDGGELREGTIVVDAWTRSNPRLIWRSTGTVKIDSKPEKLQKRIDKILDKLGKRWRKILDGTAK
jgi:hypothetical protein